MKQSVYSLKTKALVRKASLHKVTGIHKPLC